MSGKDEDDELVKIFEGSLCLDTPLDDENIFERGVIPPNLANLECPFVWKHGFTTDHRGIVDRVEEKLLEMDGEDDELASWKMFVLNLILCYEYAKSGELQGAEEKQTLCDAILNGQSVGEDAFCVVAMGSGLRHISLACKCFLLYASQLHDEVKNALDMIVPFEDLQSRDKASILCVNGAYCAEFGYSGIRESVKTIQKAVLMDEECAEWKYLLGRSLSRLRRMEKRTAIPDRQELTTLENAVKMSSNATFMVLLAQTYRETARNVRIEKRRELNSFKPICDSFNKKSMELYKNVLQQGTRNVQCLVRCALGLMKLPDPWKDLDDARRCILEALDKAPNNPMANHVAGTYFSTVEDYDQAMKYYSKASANGVFGAAIDLISLKRKLNRLYDPVADLERLIAVFKEKPHQESVLCYLGSYYYNVMKDFKKAFKYWLQVIEMDINCENLKVHYDGITHHGAVNINKVVITEIMKLLDTGDISELETQLYDRVISKYIEHHPGLVVKTTDIDVSKYRNRAFKHKSWRYEAFSENSFLSINSGPTTSKIIRGKSGRGSRKPSFFNNRTPMDTKTDKGPSCSTASVSISRGRPTGHYTAISSSTTPVDSNDKGPSCSNVSVSTSRGRPRGHGTAFSSSSTTVDSNAYKGPSCSNVSVPTSRGRPRGCYTANSSSKTPVDSNDKGPSCSNESVSTSRGRPRGHHAVFSSSSNPVDSNAYTGPSCSNASVPTSRGRPRGRYTANSSRRTPVDSNDRGPSCSNVSVSTSRGRPRRHHSRYPEEPSSESHKHNTGAVRKGTNT